MFDRCCRAVAAAAADWLTPSTVEVLLFFRELSGVALYVS